VLRRSSRRKLETLPRPQATPRIPRSQTILLSNSEGDTHMSKGMNQKRETKRKPAKTLEEKRAIKKAKRTQRAAGRAV
jgi:hypothetical protein